MIVLQRAAQISFQLRAAIQTPTEVALPSYTAIMGEGELKQGKTLLFTKAEHVLMKDTFVPLAGVRMASQVS